MFSEIVNTLSWYHETLEEQKKREEYYKEMSEVKNCTIDILELIQTTVDEFPEDSIADVAIDDSGVTFAEALPLALEALKENKIVTTSPQLVYDIEQPEKTKKIFALPALIHYDDPLFGGAGVADGVLVSSKLLDQARKCNEAYFGLENTEVLQLVRAVCLTNQKRLENKKREVDDRTNNIKTLSPLTQIIDWREI